ncbi:hypothetical protein LTR36_006675 [Oleoguttula mirabilis]|uniref:BTB domain-containing protein n=1 Tax=Oleoguttula mirabilis TaxID=1507867 RepID=A0AAV9JCW7_9PEZI|nr:hypothetical protein LTR36_006675 [Oleoguttula mirabilis]
MSASNGTKGPAIQLNGRRRHPARVVPAIPLALSKPRPARPPPPRTDSGDVGAGAAQTADLLKASTAVSDTETAQPAGTSAPVLDGREQHHTEANAVETVDHLGDGEDGVLSGTPASAGSAAFSLSADATPELPADEAATPSTPPSETASGLTTTATVSPSSARKPTDKFDMRPLRTELPPAFVPSVDHTPQSAASSAYANPQTRPYAQSIHQSSNGIIFGGHDSATSSPAPPQSASSAFQAPNYPTFGAAVPTQMPPPGHTHHASEPYTNRAFHTGYRPPWTMRQGYAPHQPQQHYFQPHAHQQFRYPPREVFTPAESNNQPNGHYSRSRSASQTSSAAPRAGEDLQSPSAIGGARESAKTMFPEPKAAFAPGPPQLRHHHHHQSIHSLMAPPPMAHHPDMTSAVENAEALRAHVLGAFADPMLADCQLEVLEDCDGSRRYVDCHKLILSRSPTLLQIIQNSDRPASATPKPQVHVPLRGRYVRIRPFMEIMRYLYGGPLLSLDQPRHPIGGPESVPNNQQRMENALQHIATGAWLQLPIVALRGVDVAANLLHWDTMPSLLAFALDGGLGSCWMVEDGSEDRISCSSSDDSHGRAEATGMPTYDPYSTTLLHRMIDFAVHLLPPNFYLDTSAAQLTSCARLPALPQGHESKPSRSDPRLGNIRFGEMSIDDHQRPSIVTTAVSSMLLSLPFALLKCILEHGNLAANLGLDTVASIMRQVVAEREVRRKRSLKARPAGHVDEGADAQLVQNLYWEEEVEASRHNRVGLRLARRRRGVDTPLSSGAASDQSK